MESARIDGASDFTIGLRIYLPLSKPVIATVALFYGIAYWNDWFNAIMLIDSSNLKPLQFLLMQLQSDLEMLSLMAESTSYINPPKESFKMATAIATIGPIILLYPFLQRYFVRGLVIGAVKG
jgi:putative aldouronate transport system permease protein